jgi:antagonist of KipI
MMGTPVLEVLEAGLLTTVQDRGRPGAVDLGVPVGGACDPWSMVVANALAGNHDAAATLEMTMTGPTLRVLSDCLVGLAGADFEALVVDDGRQLRPGAATRLRKDETLRFDVPVEGTGIRAYLAVGGGVDVPEVLGSRSTCLVGGFGGLDGRPLRVGDTISAGVSGGTDDAPVAVVAGASSPVSARGRLRVVAGPHATGNGRSVLERLLATEYTVSARSDRQGIRLDGPALVVAEASAQMLSHGVVWGAIQVPPDGKPICLLADHQTVGGYPVLAVVATIDRAALGQLGPGDAVSFELIDVDVAQRLARLQAAERADALAQLRSGG